MDRKTLEYMEKRTERAREIVNRIEKLQNILNKTKSKEFKCIRIAIDSDSIELTKWGRSAVPNEYATEVEAHMLNSFINVTNAEILHLEQELAEL